MSKTFDKKDVFSWANCEDVTINTWGYFGEGLKDLKREIKEGQEYKLLSIDSEDSYCFKYVKNDTQISCPFFLPATKVKEIQEKKYRPFKAMSEFANSLNIQAGTTIRLRIKSNASLEHVLLISGFSETHEHELKYIFLGGIKFAPEELFDNYEWFFNDSWQPFGVED